MFIASLKNTAKVEEIKPKPAVNKIIINNDTGKKAIAAVSETFCIATIIARGIKEINKLTRLDPMAVIIKTVFGIKTLPVNQLPFIKSVIEPVLPWAMKFHMINPDKRNTAYAGIFFPKNDVKITDMINIVARGSNNVHVTPRTDLLYRAVTFL